MSVEPDVVIDAQSDAEQDAGLTFYETEDRISCEELCARFGKQCGSYQDLIGGETTGKSTYEGGGVGYERCEAVPPETEPDLNGGQSPFISIRCACE